MKHFKLRLSVRVVAFALTTLLFCIGFCGCIFVLPSNSTLSDLTNPSSTETPTTSTTLPAEVTVTTSQPTAVATVATTVPTQPKQPTSKSPSSYWSSPLDYIVYSNDGYVNVRRGPSAQYEAFDTIHSGQIITALAQEGEWVFYQAPAGPNGWIHLSGLLPVNEQYWQAIMPSEYELLPYSQTKIVVANDGANLRQGPDANDYGVLTNVPKGEEVIVTAKNGAWYFCYFAQACGWTHKDNLS